MQQVTSSPPKKCVAFRLKDSSATDFQRNQRYFLTEIDPGPVYAPCLQMSLAASNEDERLIAGFLDAGISNSFFPRVTKYRPHCWTMLYDGGILCIVCPVYIVSYSQSSLENSLPKGVPGLLIGFSSLLKKGLSSIEPPISEVK